MVRGPFAWPNLSTGGPQKKDKGQGPMLGFLKKITKTFGKKKFGV
jgi:hypothetical protein